MSLGYGEGVEHPTPFGHLVDWSWVWAGLLVLGKALDTGTTAIGLLLVPGLIEANPLAAVAFESMGVLPGLAFLSVLVLACVAAVTELGAWYLKVHEEAPAWGPTAVRMVGYGPLSILFVFAGIHNAGLIVRVVLLG